MELRAIARFGDLDSVGRGRIVICDSSGKEAEIITYPASSDPFTVGLCIHSAIHDAGYHTAGAISATPDELIVVVAKGAQGSEVGENGD